MPWRDKANLLLKPEAGEAQIYAVSSHWEGFAV